MLHAANINAAEAVASGSLWVSAISERARPSIRRILPLGGDVADTSHLSRNERKGTAHLKFFKKGQPCWIQALAQRASKGAFYKGAAWATKRETGS